MNKQQIEETIREMLELYEFSIREEDGVFYLNDLQHANLGGIEQDELYTVHDLIERLEVYHIDYVVEGIEELLDDNDIEYDNMEELYHKAKNREELQDTCDLEILKLIVSVDDTKNVKLKDIDFGLYLDNEN